MSFIQHLSTTSLRTATGVAAALALSALSTPAMATAGQWDSAAAGHNGTGTSASTPWISALAEGSSYAEWNAIYGYPVDDTPDIAGAGTLTETTGSGFPTSGGNIYGFSGATAFTLDVVGATSGLFDVYLRVSTVGSAVSDIATLNGVEATRTITFSEAITGGFGGTEEESLWHWTLDATGPWVFSFTGSAAHMSLDQVAVYATAVTPAVPEPETWALMAAGLLAVGAMSRRRT